ncbi:uncharacterized protein LOC141834366 [Curcuma longa]|uniref:uncharacterized protein LOC141834366 n=1 Tax=Curcuma longa TaxID=136217 RepID=UPI003D9E6414
MLCGLLGGKFFKKCKHSAKSIRTRIVPIRSKKQATVRLDKTDVANRIAAGQEANAYGRIDALMVEINYTSCYDIIDQHCEYILNHLPDLQKQRECPQEAMEAIATLIYAAARFSDLPELCDLRHVFTERYGSSMDSSINAEFVDKFQEIQEKSFSEEKKLQLMQSIAEEFSVRWDSKRLEHLSSNATPRASSVQPGRKPVQVGTKEKASSIERYPPNPASVARKEQIEAEPKNIHVDSAAKNGKLYNHVVSLPSASVSTAEVNAPARATSMPPEQLNPNGGRVHPNMPDYFQLAARLAALRNA